MAAFHRFPNGSPVADGGSPPAALPVAADADPLLSSRLPSLDGLRFLAALMVLIYHGGAEEILDGVSFFFVLSGFLFAVLLDREYRWTGTIALGSFYIRRAIRILPAFYATLLVTIVGKLLLGHPVAYGHAAAAALFVGNYYNALFGHPPTGFAHMWSLGVEEQFYLIWPLTFLILSRIGRRWLMGFLALSIVGAGGWRTYALWSGLGSDAYAYNAFECRFDMLACGCLLGLLIASPRFRAVIHRSCRTGLEPILLTAVLTGFSMAPSEWSHGPLFTLEAALMGLVMLQLVVLGSHPLYRWLNWRPIRFLGTLSYSAYLLHAWGLALAAKFTGLPLAGRIAIGVVATMGLAWLQYLLVERPALAWRERFRSDPQREADESPVHAVDRKLLPGREAIGSAVGQVSQPVP